MGAVRWYTYTHLDRQFELYFDDLNQSVLMNSASLVRVSAEGDERVQVLVCIAFVVVRKLVLLVPLDAGEEGGGVEFDCVLGLEVFLHLGLNLFRDVETAS